MNFNLGNIGHLGLIAKDNRVIAPGKKFDKYFPLGSTHDSHYMSSDDVFATRKNMIKVVNRSLDETADISEYLKGKDLKDLPRSTQTPGTRKRSIMKYLILLQQNLSKELVDVFSKTLEEAKKVDPNSAENMTIIYLFASIALVFLIGFITYFWYNERKKDNLMNTIIEKECADNIQRQEDRREIANLTVSLKLLAEKLQNFINYQQKRNEG